MLSLNNLQKEVEISRLAHTILEDKLRLAKKFEEIKRLEIDIEKNEIKLQEKKEGNV